MGTKKLIVAILTMMVAIGAGVKAHALKYPHNNQNAVQLCTDCHARTAPGFKMVTSFQGMLCFNPTLGCHRPGGAAQKKQLAAVNASNRFGKLPAVSGAKQSSHGWKMPASNPTAGVPSAPSWGELASGSIGTVLARNVGCTRCHRAHGEKLGYIIYDKFLRANPKGDDICLQCHTARRVGKGAARSAPAAGKDFTHPVEVDYYANATTAAKKDYFEATPQLPAGYNASARPRLYTTIGDVSGAVVCSSCHGPIHSADSNPYTFDNLTSYAQRPYSSSAGNLLRQYPMSKSGHENNLCMSCHKVETHQTATKCSDCHEIHRKSSGNLNDKNIYLIRTSIMTPYGKRSVQFQSTSLMAQRYGNYSSPVTARSNKICQVCHRNKMYHRAYSTAGAKRDHNYNSGTGKYANCVGCHPHVNSAVGGAFKLGGEAACGACHKAPPLDSADGKHWKHIGADGGSNYDWIKGEMKDERSAERYGFSCGRCHSPWRPYTSTLNYPNHRPSSSYDDGVVKGYTTEVGFKIRTGFYPLNTKADYVRGTAGTSDGGATAGGSRFAWSDGQCRNLYCHGQFFGGYTSANPTWNGSLTTCSAGGACHGTTSAKLPGVNGVGEWGAHRRHLGNAGQQYGAGGQFWCNACHNATAGLNNATTVNRAYHVNGKINVRFDAAYKTAVSKYGVLNDYSGRTNTAETTKTQYKSCQLIYCHSDGSRMSNFSAPFDNGAKNFPNWSSTRNYTTTVSGLKRRCVRCHGNATYKGLTASMPIYASRPDKGNSHEKHIRNGFLCVACHSQTVGTDNKSIADVSKHVNKNYEVNFLSRYDAGGAVYNGDKTCSNIKCHGGRKSAQWGQTGACKDCHFKSSAEATTDEGYADNYSWRNMTSNNSVPRIYSSEWTKSGHGLASGTYPSSSNVAANKGCSFAEGGCHKASGLPSHQSAVSGNTYRLYTGYGSGRSDYLCEECHMTGGSRSGEASKKVTGHSNTGMGGWGDATWAFTPKCIDCHDPHGDNNRYMVQKFLNITGSDTYGKIANSNYARQVTFTTVGGGLMNWSSYVNNSFTGICQRCHNTQANMDHFNESTYNTSHNARNRCTGCHKHDAGFKGMDCDGCHYFPPALSGKHSFHVATTVSSGYVGYDMNNTKTKYAYGCGKCHDSGSHYVGTSGNYTTEVVFDANDSYPRNADASAQYVFGAKSSFDEGTDGVGAYKWTSTKGTCQNLFCHGKFSGGKTANTPAWYGTSVCGDCHGASQADYPTGGAHLKHVNRMAYDCRNCHDDTVNAGITYPALKDKRVHVDGKTQYKLYTAWSARIGGAARYNNTIFGRATTEVSSPTYGYCTNIYCHSKGSDMTNPYNDAASLSNYTAKWGDSLGSYRQTRGLKAKCNYCHGSKSYSGSTSAMPNYVNGTPKANSHAIHVLSNALNCNICHYGVAKNNTGISDLTRHADRFYNISIAPGYGSGAGLKRYSSVPANNGGYCMNITCHGLGKPKWGSTLGCRNCHFSNSGDTNNYANWSGFKGTAALIYSTEWSKKGHAVAGADCANCHKSTVAHGASNNPYRLYTSDPNRSCGNCHGIISERGSFGGSMTATSVDYQVHSKALAQAGTAASWNNFQGQSVKCVDCHDPHGDKNRKMIHTQINYTGSDKFGRPSPNFTNVNPAAVTQMTFTTLGASQLYNWSSYANTTLANSLCRRCHTSQGQDSGMGDQAGGDMTKANYAGAHQGHQKCTGCHKHTDGFKGGGCSGCHGTQASSGAPPDSATTWTADKAATASSVGLHEPHGYNPRNRPGIPSSSGFSCTKCHGPETDGRSEATHPSAGGDIYAGMGNMTSQGTTRSERSKFSYGALDGKTNINGVTDDTCSNTGCHTPRVYGRTWKKPVDCDDCHGFRNTPAKDGIGAGTYSIITSGSHKMHAYSSGAFRYSFACRNCHKYVGNNYTTHYSGFVNITFAQALGQPAASGTYGRGLTGFKGFTTTGGEWATCANVYCHGNFSGGLNASPKWGSSGTAACGTCHAINNTLALRHPNHINNYSYGCRRCHNATAGANNSVIDQRTHVNNVENVLFNSSTYAAGVMNNATGKAWGANDAKRCRNVYCHSSGARTSGTTWHTRTTISNYTARWDASASIITSGKPCSLCHGNRTGNPNGSYAGITSAMPNYNGQAHKVHVVQEKFRCNVCHASTVNASGTIVSYTNHVNRFKNISIIASYKSGATNYSEAVKTCDNVKCHALRTTPAWSTTARCQDCHYTTGSETVNYEFRNYSVTASVASIYSSDWSKKGHGTATANRVCTRCHNSGVAHNNTNNPFRLYTSDPDALCGSCHGNTSNTLGKWSKSQASGDFSNVTGYKTHSKANTGPGDAQWNQFPSNAARCVDCHDPHGDKNKKMMQAYVNISGSDRFGRPSNPPSWNSVNTATAVQMTFTSWGGQLNWSSFANADVNRSICRRCHSAGDSGVTANMTKALYDGNHQANHEKCTNSCHKHKGASGGFGAAGGESSGGSDCGGCHSALKTQGTGTYHHVIQDTSAGYQNKTSFAGTSADFASSARKCLMCHVDHDIFRDINTGIGKRAKNLRVNGTGTAIAQGDANDLINTDFWPAKRSAPRADGTANYNATMPVDGPAGSNGVCISCHDAVQYKNTTLQADQTRRTMQVSLKMYTSSSHNFQAISGINNFDDGSSFRANCIKCHNSSILNKPSAQSGKKSFGLHDSNRESLLNMTTGGSGLPQRQTLCYKCHSQDSYKGYDYYSSVKMASSSKLIKTAVVAKTSGHPMGENPGAHFAAEYMNATSAQSSGTTGYPNYGWNRPGYKDGRHVECVDCHNTHGGNASIKRLVGTANGNKVSGAQIGAWGVTPDYTGVPKGGRPKYVKTLQVTYQYELCLKCHSGYAYYTSAPDIPSGSPDMAGAHVNASAYDTVAAGIAQTDLARDFNPNNPGFHPVIAKGRNQPPVTANSNWPTTPRTIRYVMSSYSAPIGSAVPTGDVKFNGISGLDWTFVPPYNQDSKLACSDCHQADNSGNAVGQLAAKTIKGGGTSWGTGWSTGRFVSGVWTADTGPAYPVGAVSDTDGWYARISASTAVMEFDVRWTEGGYPVPDSSISKVEAVYVGYGTGGKANRDFTPGVFGDNAAKTISPTSLVFGAGQARLVTTVTATNSWATIDHGTDSVQDNAATDLKEYSVKVNKADTTGDLYFDYIGIAITYKAPGDLRGPHGSLEKWLLQDVDPGVLFDADLSNTLVRQASCSPGSTCDSMNASIYGVNKRAFCVNCHRADVYWGAPLKANYSRVTHPVGSSNHWTDGGDDTVWGNPCMLCHGGKGSNAMKETVKANIKASGGIHGVFGTSTLWGTYIRPAYNASSFKVFNRPVGVRLLLGGSAGIAADANNVYCYTNSAADGTGSCTSETGKLLGDAYSANYGNTDVTNYTYTGW